MGYKPPTHELKYFRAPAVAGSAFSLLRTSAEIKLRRSDNSSSASLPSLKNLLSPQLDPSAPCSLDLLLTHMKSISGYLFTNFKTASTPPGAISSSPNHHTYSPSDASIRKMSAASSPIFSPRMYRMGCPFARYGRTSFSESSLELSSRIKTSTPGTSWGTIEERVLLNGPG